MTERVYRRTAAGQKAWDTQSPQVALELRRVLGLIKSDIHYDTLRSALGARYSQEGMQELMAELEFKGLVESEQTGAEQDLDFTSSMNVADLVAAHNKK
jgi:hypothetical protein